MLKEKKNYKSVYWIWFVICHFRK